MASFPGQKGTGPPLPNPDITPPAVPPAPTLLFQNNLQYLIGWPHSVDPVVPPAVTSGTKDYTVYLSGVAQPPPISDTAGLAAPVLTVVGTNVGGGPMTGTDNGSVLTATSVTGDTGPSPTADEYVYVASIARGPVVVALHITAETLVGAFSKRGVRMSASLANNAVYYDLLSFGPAQGLKGEQRVSTGAAAGGGAQVAFPGYPFWVRTWMDVNGVLTRDYSTNSATGALGDGTWTVYDTQTPAFGPAFYVGRFADPNTGGGTGGTTSCTFDQYYTSGLAGLTFAGTGTAGTTVPATVSARDNALNPSAQSPPLSLVFSAPPAVSAPFPFWTAMSLIGGNRTGYATTQFRVWASKNGLVLMQWLPGMDFTQGATMNATMQDIINRSPIGTICGLSHDVQIVFNPGIDQKYWNMLTANHWMAYTSYPNGTIVPVPGQTALFLTNLLAGGTLNAAGQNLQRYDAFFLNAYMIAGDQSVVTSQNNVPNPLVAFINSDDRFTATPATADWNRDGSAHTSATDTALRNGNVALDAALRAATGRAVCCNIGRLNGLNGTITEYLANKTEYGFADQQIGTGFTYEANNDRATFVANMNALGQAVSRLAGAAHFNVRPDGSDPVTFDNTSPSRPALTFSPPHQGARHAMCAFAVLSDLGYGPSATTANDCNQTPIWWDYQSVNLATRTAYSYPNVDAGLGYLGAWIDPPQSAPQPGTTGFRRRAQNGEVWWFSRRDPAGTVNFGRTLYKIFGPQNPTFDDGSAVTQYAFQPRDGFLGLYSAGSQATNHGDLVTITGSGFPSTMPTFFFEGGAAGLIETTSIGNTPVSPANANPANQGPTYINGFNYYRFAANLAVLNDGTRGKVVGGTYHYNSGAGGPVSASSEVTFPQVGYGGKVMFKHYCRRLVATDAPGGAGQDGQYKYYRMQGNPSDSNIGDNNYQMVIHWLGRLATTSNGNGFDMGAPYTLNGSDTNGSETFFTGNQKLDGTWQRHEIKAIAPTAGGGSHTGQWYQRTTANTVAAYEVATGNKGDLLQSQLGAYPDSIARWFALTYQDGVFNGFNDWTIAYDDRLVQVGSYFCVELWNDPNPANATIREFQELTACGSSSLTIRFNKGAFPSGTGYLVVLADTVADTVLTYKQITVA